MSTKITQDPFNAEYPARKKAIEILEFLETYKGRKWQGELWYELEDKLTSIIDERKSILKK